MEFLYLLEKIRCPFLDVFFQIVTEFGYELIALGVICVFFWCVNKNFGYEMGFAFFASGMLVQGLKITFRIDRPWVLDPDFKPVGSAMEDATGYSFPSGHTQCGTTLFSSLAIRFKQVWLKVVFVLMFLLVGLSRMYLGVHTPKDVLVSMALTLVCVFIFHKVFAKIADNKKHDLLIALVLSVVSLGVMIYSLVLESKGIITDPKYALDCCKTGGAGLGFAIGWYIERRWIDFSVQTKKMWQQFVKVAVGIAIALVLKEVPKSIFGDTAIVGMIRYMIVTFWIVGVYPAIAKKLFCKE